MLSLFADAFEHSGSAGGSSRAGGAGGSVVGLLSVVSNMLVSAHAMAVNAAG